MQPANPKLLEDFIRTRAARALDVDASTLDPMTPFRELGLDSVRAVGLLADLASHLRMELDPTLVFEFPTMRELAVAIVNGAQASPTPNVNRETPTSGRAAIVGMACRFPGAPNLSAFAKLLELGQCAIASLPSDRFPRTKDARVRYAGIIEAPDEFDHAFFGISPHEALVMDPQQRLLLELVWVALEDAGLPPSELRDTRCGVFVGVSTNEYAQRALHAAQDRSGHEGTGNALSISANRISYVYGFTGPSLAVDTACSSSAVALHLARQSLANGDCDMAVVAGANLLLSEQLFATLETAGMLSASGVCRTFDEAADGYVRGEGVGVVVLKPEQQAMIDGDRIYAILAGSAVNQDGRRNGLTAPNPRGQEAVIREAWASGGLTPDMLQYVEAHGTGTRLGDPIEVNAVGRVIGSVGKDRYIGSVKTNIGHLEAAAGIAGIIKTALAIERGFIPPTLHFQKPNAMIGFEKLGLQVPTSCIPWPQGERRRAGVSSFGFGGTNAHLVLESAEGGPVTSSDLPSPDQDHVLVVSAHTSAAALELARKTSEAIREMPGADVADVCYTSSCRRAHHRYRIAAVGKCNRSIATELDHLMRGSRSAKLFVGERAGYTAPKALFVYSGQGNDWHDFARQLCELYPAFQAKIRELDSIFTRIAGWSVAGALLGGDRRFNETTIAQPAVVVLQLALTVLLRDAGITPSGVIGHSVGEISAAVAAGILEPEVALELVFHRSRHMETAAGRGGMLAIAIDDLSARDYIARVSNALEISAVNGHGDIVVSGPHPALKLLEAAAKKDQLRTHRVSKGYPFHSSAMDGAVKRFESALKDVRMQPPIVPMYSTVSGEVLSESAPDPTYWAKNIRQPVLYHRALRKALEDGYAVAIELGPESPLLPLTKRTLREQRSSARALGALRRGHGASSSVPETVAELYTCGFDVDWTALHPRGGKVVPLPGLPWERQRFWLPPQAPATEVNLDDDRAHALLGVHAQLDHGHHVWLKERGAWHQLVEHRVRGNAILPAAAYVAAAWDAATAAGLANVELDDVRITSALPLESRVSLRADLTLLESGSHRFTLSRIDCETGTDSMPLMECIVRPSQEGTPDNLQAALTEAQVRCLTHFETGEFYEKLAQYGLDYGPSFRLLKNIWYREGESLGNLLAPRPVGFRKVSPQLLDAALHAIAAAMPESRRGDLFIPVEVGLCNCVRPPIGSVRVHARVHVDSADSGVLRADVDLCNEEGDALLRMERVLLRQLGRSAAGTLASKHPAQQWQYEVTWEQQLSSELTTPAQQLGGRWLILADGSGFATAVAQNLAAEGAEVVEVRVGPERERTPYGHAIRRGSQDLRDVIRYEMAAGSRPFIGVVDCMSGDEGDGTIATSSTNIIAQILAPFLELAKALAYDRASESARLFVVTRQARPVLKTDACNALGSACLWGFTKAVPFEQQDLQCTRIDVDESPATVHTLVRLLQSNPGEDQYALRNGELYCPRLTQMRADTRAETGPVRPEATYLVTGGFGGLGPTVCEWLVQRGARHLLVLGRQRPSAAAESRLEHLRELGAAIEVKQIDVTDYDRVAEVLNSVPKDRPLGGIVHAAGVLHDAAFLDVTREQLAEVLKPKVDGAWTLHQLTAQLPNLDFFVLFSSAASIVGSPGQASYMAANAFLDSLAHFRRARGLPALSVNWGPFDGPGMVAAPGRAEGLKATGVRLIEPVQGMQILEGLLAEGCPQAAVLPFDPESVVYHYPSALGMRFFERVLGASYNQVARASVAHQLTMRPDLRTLYAAPTNEIEGVIAGFWQRALGIDRVGVDDAFFELGGDSVFAHQLLGQIQQAYNVRIEPGQAFREFTVRNLAVMVEEALTKYVQELSDVEATAALERQDSPSP